MRKLIAMVAMAMMMPVLAWSQKCTLTGTLSGVPAGVSVLVREPDGGQLVTVDTINLDKAGHYQIRREGAEPQFFVMAIPGGSEEVILHVMLMPKEKVTMDIRYEPDIRVMRITEVRGSENMALYKRFNNLLADAAVESSLQAMVPVELERMLGENSGLLMSAFLVTFFERAFDHYAGLYKKIRDALHDDYANHMFVRHLDDKLRGVLVAGMEAPDIALADTNGVVRRLSDLRGKVVLIDFWASWCRPCRMENPNVVRMYEQFHDKGFEIYSVSLDNVRERWVSAIKEDGLVWPNHVSDLRGWSSAGGQAYGISSIPATVVVDREGNIVARNLRGAQLEQKLNEILTQ